MKRNLQIQTQQNMKPCLLLSCSSEYRNREKVYEEREKTHYMPVTGWKVDATVPTQTKKEEVRDSGSMMNNSHYSTYLSQS